MATLGPYRPGPSGTDLNGVYHGDCNWLARAIPDASIPLIVADPPYGIGYASSWKTRMGGGARVTRSDFGADEFDPSWLTEAARVLSDGGALYLFTRWDVLHQWKAAIEAVGLKVVQRLVWDKQHWGMGDLRYYGSQTEDILFAVKGEHKMRWDKRSGNLWSVNKMFITEGQLNHPTQKPESLIARMVENSSDPGDVVLDFHGGSGSTAAAAYKLGRRWLTFDIERTFCKMARQRLAGMTPPLLVPQAEQMSMEIAA
ncbi:MAG TPA: site-specific DNA-methyltransferase [Bellilinea sp.]|nr:site-specific DNA-methyltransferase [Bellilinea sp.]